jgi:predicted AAA+ superfamily ATPase
MIERKIKQKLITALSDSPVVLLHGARQTGKSTLVKYLAENDYPAKYLTCDDPGILSAALNNPMEFLTGYDGSLIIDEVQKVPDIFVAIKNVIDKNRKAGKYILTGSSNVLLLPKVSESLAGRIEILQLFPFSQNEITGSNFNFIDEVFNIEFKPTFKQPMKNDIVRRVMTGGFPEMLRRNDRSRQNAWFKSYITTILQRDVRDISSIEKLSELPKLLSIFSARAGTLLNFAEFSRSAAIPQTTLKRYTALLEAVFMIYLLPAWSGNLSKRLIKTPKLYISDTGLLTHIIGFEPDKILYDTLSWGRILENFVLIELLKQSSWSQFNLSLYHLRTSSGHEIDFVIERSDGRLVGIEVKASAKISSADFNHLKMFADETGKKFFRGIVIYTGKESIPFGKNMFALPIDILW